MGWNGVGMGLEWGWNVVETALEWGWSGVKMGLKWPIMSHFFLFLTENRYLPEAPRVSNRPSSGWKSLCETRSIHPR